jgi:hypothetical protein
MVGGMTSHSQPSDAHQLRAAARILGEMSARTGDHYDVVEEFSRGWAAGLLAADPDLSSAPYTTRSQAGPAVEASGEASHTADQATPAPDIDDLLRLQLVCLSSLAAAVDTITQWRVDDARERRWTWKRIAEPLEISEQGAHKRFRRLAIPPAHELKRS